MLVFINEDVACTNFKGGGLIFEEVIIALCLFLGYDPQINKIS